MAIQRGHFEVGKQKVNRKTTGNLTLQRRNSALDSFVSINVTSRKFDAFAGLPPKTLVNGINYLAMHWKTNGQEMTRQRHPALTTAKGPRMAIDVYDETTESFKSDWLYFIRSEDGFIKIGRSGNVQNRLTRLRTGNPKKLYLVGSLENSGWSEKLWHHAFQMQRVRGEWFEPNRCLNVAIKRALAGKEWICILKAPPELAPYYPGIERHDLDVQWRHEVADYEEILQEAMYDAWEPTS